MIKVQIINLVDNDVNIGRVLKHLMKAKGLTYKKLSKASGVPESTIKSWSANVEPKSLVPARKVARILGVSVEYLVFGSVDEPKPNLNQILTKQLFSGWCKVTIEVPDSQPVSNEMLDDGDN